MPAGFFVKGILIGLLFGIPVGAVGTPTVQRTFRQGFADGLKTGLGSSAADCIYAACGAFGLTDPRGLLCGMAESMGGAAYGKGSLEGRSICRG